MEVATRQLLLWATSCPHLNPRASRDCSDPLEGGDRPPHSPAAKGKPTASCYPPLTASSQSEGRVRWGMSRREVKTVGSRPFPRRSTRGHPHLEKERGREWVNMKVKVFTACRNSMGVKCYVVTVEAYPYNLRITALFAKGEAEKWSVTDRVSGFE